jgi:hypothetical protein
MRYEDNRTLKELSKEMADTIAFEDGTLKKHTKAKFVGKSMKDLLNNAGGQDEQ